MTWIVILAVGAGSYLFRLGPLLAFQRISLGERGDQMIRNGGTAAIAALIVTSTKHSATGSATLPTLLAIAIAVVVAARGASMLRLLIFAGGTYAFSIIVIDLLVR